MLTRQSKRKRHSDDIGVDTKDFTRSREYGGLLANKPVHSRASVGDDGDAARVQLIESIREQWPDCLVPRCRRIRSLYSPEVDKKLRARGGEAHRLVMPGRADEKGYLIIVSGQMLTSRYRIMGAIGKGTFSKVVECVDMETETDVAVKIVRNIEKYTKASMNEIMIIMTMMQYDPTGLFDFVRLSNWFVYPHGGHVTMVFPKLGPSLYETMNRNDDRPFPVYMIRKYLKRLCQTLAFMHSIGIVHTDVKPENILHDNVRYEEVTSEHPGLASEFPKSDTLTLIDFGSAQFIERSHQKLVSTRHYRAPEVLLGLSWSLSIDVWSVGCVLLEFVVGSTLFCNHDVRAAPEDKDMEQLGMIERALGKIPPALAQRCEPHTKTYEDVFRPNGTLRYPTSTTTRLIDRSVPYIYVNTLSIATSIYTSGNREDQIMYQIRKAFCILLLSLIVMAGTIAAQTAGDDVKNAADTVASGAKDVGNDIASGATSAGETIASGAASAGEAIASGATSAGEAVGDAAKDAFTSFAWAPSHLMSSLVMACAALMF